MIDKAFMKEQVFQGMERLFSEGTEAEISVMTALVELQIRKFAFIRTAEDMGLSLDQLKTRRQAFIVDRAREVMQQVDLLEETDTNALQAFMTPKH